MRYLSKTIIPSPLGKLSAIASEQGLCALTFQEEAELIETRILKYYPESKFGPQFRKTLEETKAWLNDYFSKNFTLLKCPAIDLRGSHFAIAAWKNLLQIPVGKTKSYGELAKKLKAPNASRAIGRIMGQNPIVILLPCHRIIGANKSLTGYGGGLDRKEWLLRHEGHCLE